MKNFFLVFVLSLTLFLSTNILSAQEEQNIFLPTANTETINATDENVNIYLQDNKPVQQQVKSPAQVANGKLSGIYEGSKLACPYAFERDLQLGSKGEDVRLLQVLLNSDRRTLVALDGPGSQGKEGTNFGEATKTAVKRFQALFIEYVGVANGRFGPRTRTVMNAICANGVRGGGSLFNYVPSIQANATPAGEITTVPTDKISPRVSLSANANTVAPAATFKVVVNLSEEVKPITPDSVIVDGGVVKEIRKLSKVQYSLFITPNDDAKNVVIQVEADKVEDLAGNLNEVASNEVMIKIKQSLADTLTGREPTVDDLLNKIVASAPQCKYNSQGQLITVDPNTNQPINTTGCANTGSNSSYATFNSQLGCYGDNGPLPAGIQETQRCSNPQNPNNPSSPCSAAYQQQVINQSSNDYYGSSYYGYGGYGSYAPYNPCTNASVVANTNKQIQDQRKKDQQQDQNNALGQMLGNLLGKQLGGSGGGLFGGGKDGGGGARDSSNPAPTPRDTSTTPPPDKNTGVEGGSDTDNGIKYKSGKVEDECRYYRIGNSACSPINSDVFIVVQPYSKNYTYILKAHKDKGGLESSQYCTVISPGTKKFIGKDLKCYLSREQCTSAINQYTSIERGNVFSYSGDKINWIACTGENSANK